MRTVLTAIAATVVAMSAPVAAADDDEPEHTVLTKDGKIEVRTYPELILASVTVSASQRRASGVGFDPLGGYIFGNNQARDKIDMTTPVTQVRSQKIDMTTPVTQTAAGPDDLWTISFIMPPEWTMETLPVPNDQRVELNVVPPRTMAAIRFNGTAPPRVQNAKQAELEAWIEANGYRMTGPVEFAYYSPPWIAGPFRRNEVMVPVEKAG